jgi:hypothetical protein
MRAGLDGEPATLAPPLRFVTRPGALVVRLPLAPPRSTARRLVEESRHLVSVATGRGMRDRATPELIEAVAKVSTKSAMSF